MHAFCLISVAGTSKPRAHHVRNHPPTMKIRRSNAVQTRRLALHVDLLDRHLAILETERARAVRLLREELQQLQGPGWRLSTVSSPHSKNDVHQAKPVADHTISAAGYDRSKAEAEDRTVECDHDPVHQPSQIGIHADSSTSLSKHQEGPSVCGSHEGRGSPAQQHEVSTLSGRPAVVIPDGRGGVYLSGKSGRCTVRGSDEGVIEARVVQPRQPPSYRQDPDERHSHRENQSVQRRDTEEGKPSTKEGEGEHISTQQWDGAVSQTGKKNSSKARTIAKAEQPTQATEAVSEHTPSSRVLEAEQPSLSTPSTTSSPKLPEIELRQSPHRKWISQSLSAPTHHVHKACHMVGQARHSCSYFPCSRPPTYHSLGFHPDTSTHTWRGWMARNASRPHHRLAPDRQHQPSLADLEGRAATPADTPGYARRKKLDKETLVKLDMARKKTAHHLARPPSWNTNYGQPTPYKRLNYVARLKPLL